jgi:hypothetical protein
VSLATDVTAALPSLRVQAESLHQDTFKVLRATGNKVTDPVTLVESDEFSTVHASVSGKFQMSAAGPLDVAIPGQNVAESNLQWHTSVNTLGVLTGDVVECTAVGPLGDPNNVGLRLRITGPFLKSLATARRFPVQVYS